MKRIFGLLFLLLIAPWLANAAAIEPTAADQIAHSTVGAYQLELRLRTISQKYPQLIEYLMRKYSATMRIEIPGFAKGTYFFKISSNSKLVIVAICKNSCHDHDNEFFIWDLKTNKKCCHIIDDHLACMGRPIITSSNKIIFPEDKGRISVWDLNTGKRLLQLLEAGSGPLALAADESQLVTLSQHYIHLWNIETGERIKKILCDDAAYARHIAISPDCKTIAIATDHRIYFIDVETGQETSSFMHDDFQASRLIFSLDGTKITADILGRPFRHEYRAKWDIDTGQQLSRTEYEIGYFSGDDINVNKKMRSSADDIIAVYDDKTDQFLCSGKNDIGYAITDHWFVITGDGGKIYAYDLDKLVAFQHAIASLSDRTFWLLDVIRQGDKKNAKLAINCENSKMADIIQDYMAIPDYIWKILLSDANK